MRNPRRNTLALGLSVLAAAARGRIATIPVSGLLGDDALAGFSLLDGPTTTRAVASIHRQLERALEDPLTRGVLLEVRGSSNLAAIEELRPRIFNLAREKGWVLWELHRERASLERLFRQLTASEVPDENGAGIQASAGGDIS